MSDKRRRRQAAGLTQRQVADGVGVSQSLISDWERGVDPYMSLGVLEALQRVYAAMPEPLPEVEADPALLSLVRRAVCRQSDIARRSGVRQEYISQFETGGRVPKKVQTALLTCYCELLDDRRAQEVVEKYRELKARQPSFVEFSSFVSERLLFDPSYTVRKTVVAAAQLRWAMERGAAALSSEALTELLRQLKVVPTLKWFRGVRLAARRNDGAQ